MSSAAVRSARSVEATRGSFCSAPAEYSARRQGLRAPAVRIQPARVVELGKDARLGQDRIERALDLAVRRLEPEESAETQRLGAQLHQELLAQRELRLDVLHVVVRAELGELGGGVDGVGEAAQVVDEPDALRIGARPDTPLCDLVDVLDALLAALADPMQEFVVGVIDRALQDLLRGAVERPVEAHLAGERRRAETVDLDAELF